MSNSTLAAQAEFRQSLREGCHAYVEGYGTSYGYQPSLAAGIVFCVLFGVSMLAHLVQMVWKRTWWCTVFVLGCATELIGWAGRTWSADCPYNSTAFLMQISTLIIAPTFFTAGIYVLLGRFIALMGPETSMLSPKLYLWIFVTCDVVSLVVQAIGGGLASIAYNSADGNTEPGTHTMVAGIVFQLVSITVFVLLAADFVRRTLRLRLLQTMTGSVVPLLGAMILSVIVIYVRSIYRTIELSQGWSGYLITHEVYFIVLDGVMMVIAVAVFNIFHPGWLLPKGAPKPFHREINSFDMERR
ncbi:RTA1-domain-containing protein [Aspergillus japonicus CBS 114.51]|uniref:RTA1-domain-containing protein n=3 Tax=Aspergillus TaxID=5052 RepID=A0A2V5H032_ASPV1|nr:RTA1-domain-containing protein [Aspergillus japonicus CBS 114.51]PYI15052.1 RTA1-domain-containing protein [Aspergillus violaceofuscus CBS 115571]PYI34131.1 RTA1-domain-containing protein [Aspergillus indologenus CBS 114.80]RAH77511.1 RTA1-domain-containing protein [Aspergillus japonicus CBS 114.51]